MNLICCKIAILILLLAGTVLLASCVGGGPWYLGRGREILTNDGCDKEYITRMQNDAPGVPDTLQLTLSRHQDFQVRCVIAIYRHARSDILESLSYDHNENVRMYVGRNPSTSASILDRLKQDKSDLVRKNIQCKTVDTRAPGSTLPTPAPAPAPSPKAP